MDFYFKTSHSCMCPMHLDITFVMSMWIHEILFHMLEYLSDSTPFTFQPDPCRNTENIKSNRSMVEIGHKETNVQEPSHQHTLLRM
ncbi:hypothetical protein GDO81_007709 [Engystomops pustulosus]|uniref:Uncharacterized protein n=1 Tax=Engystomops pustulosus TaxID=76066 RepID=A0AAV7C9D8_ENGPU|nr:hypothetical protein GDO81_007709 [Engystomops pustulosus]